MMPSYKTPGVYTVEIPRPISSVTAVATSVPAFIGYTEKAEKKAKNVALLPVRLSSMSEFLEIFGGPPPLEYKLAETPSKRSADFAYFRLITPQPYFRLYRSMQLFFSNGGGSCYVISAGDYSSGVIEHNAMESALERLLQEQEPTMVVIPEAVSLTAADCYHLQQVMLLHCAKKTRSRFAILDIHHGFDTVNNSVVAFRNHVNSAAMGSFGAAYYPWVNTLLIDNTELDYTIFDMQGRAMLQRAIAREIGNMDARTKTIVSALTDEPPKRKGRLRSASPEYIDKALRVLSAIYVDALKACATDLNLMPPSGAMAGLFVKTDTQRGVWKAPANISMNSIVSPAVTISDAEQQVLNSDPSGKSVNAIRQFAGQGVLVWGARTLDGNSSEWRYVCVRRTCIMLEQSIQNATSTVVFEPNDEPLWITMKQRVVDFLMELWRQGGLAGAKADEAFFVQCGLGETMTANDIAAGNLKISVGVAMVRPAEFIILNIEQQLQTP